ncbi:MAG: hypothetical protein HQL80_03430 [Magnetococcales bacterium]|nr:hypothetical protein [Magnetococcales bacterium]
MEKKTVGPMYRYVTAITGIIAITVIARLNLEGVLPLMAGITCCGLFAGLLLRASITPSYNSRC